MKVASLAAVGLAVAVMTGCATGTPEVAPARAVTSAEAQLLAIARFQNFEARTRPFETAFTLSGVDVTMRGWVDYVAQLGYASVEGEFGTEAVLWTDSSLGAIPHPTDSDGYPSFPIPSPDEPLWQIQELDASSSALGALVATISALGSERPDNPLLLQQSGALWLREDDIEGTPVTVFAAPASDAPLEDGVDAVDPDASTLRLWVDSTGLLRRAEVALNDRWTVVDFPDLSGPELSLPAGTG